MILLNHLLGFQLRILILFHNLDNKIKERKKSNKIRLKLKKQ
jgi:hypothetical protein